MMIQRGGTPEAEQALRAFLAQHPEDERALRLLSIALLRQNRTDEALEAAEQACRAAPAIVQCWLQMTHVQIARHDASAAVESAERAVRIAPHNAFAHHALARAHLTLESRYRWYTAADPAAALAATAEAVRLSPETVDYRNTRAWALVLLKRRQEATEEYLGVLRDSPDNTAAVNGLGFLNRSRRPLVSTRYYVAALRLSPHSTVVQMNLKFAARSWVYRMTWIWLWGGMALVALRGWAAPGVLVLGLAGLLVTCLVGSIVFLSHLPRGAVGVLSRVAWNSPVPVLVRMSICVATAAFGALGPPSGSLVAGGALIGFAVVVWKVDMTEFDRRTMARVRRTTAS